jgi:hypothetical protein
MYAKISQANNTDKDEVTSRRMEQCEKLLKENAEEEVSKNQAIVTDT